MRTTSACLTEIDPFIVSYSKIMLASLLTGISIADAWLAHFSLTGRPNCSRNMFVLFRWDSIKAIVNAALSTWFAYSSGSVAFFKLQNFLIRRDRRTVCSSSTEESEGMRVWRKGRGRPGRRTCLIYARCQIVRCLVIVSIRLDVCIEVKVGS